VESEPEGAEDQTPDLPTASSEVAWEGSGLLPLRWLRTLAQALRPSRTTPAFAEATARRPAVFFALLTTLPLVLLEGIIPYTHRLRFGDVFGIRANGTTEEITLDVLWAMGASVLVTGAALLVWGASFVSLMSAFGRPAEDRAATPKTAALRAVLYGSWLIPMVSVYSLTPGARTGLLLSFTLWAIPGELSSTTATILFVVWVISSLWLFTWMRHVAERACGVPALQALFIVVIPLVAATLVEGIALGVLEPWMPTAAPPPAEPG